VYLAAAAPGDRVSLRKYGVAQINGVPFALPDPGSSPGGKNVIVLKGGAVSGAISQSMPQSVDLPVRQPAGRLHLLGAVAGWGWPATRAKEPALTITIHYEGGDLQKIELLNGIDISDHAGPIDVPGSARTSLVAHGQMRYLWRDLDHPGRLVESLTLSSHARSVAPLVAALTIESPDTSGIVAPAPTTGGPVAPVGQTGP
jgi:hypothetical protein